MKRWDDELYLLTPEEFEKLDNGIMLKCIDGELVTKGVDYIDMDVRGGCIAFGLTEELIKSQNLEHEFMIYIIGS
jgi:hypothetical protein